MEKLQKVFKQSYVDELREAIAYPDGRALYLEEQFPYDDKQVSVLAGVVHPEGLEDKMLAASSEYDAAIIM